MIDADLSTASPNEVEPGTEAGSTDAEAEAELLMKREEALRELWRLKM